MSSSREGYHDLPLSVPCGRCIGCRLERARQWAVRLMHEASMHEENSFITLTYGDEHLPKFGSLVPRDFQLFMKRLRKANSGRRIRFYHCGEYGARTNRPHYHCCLFGFDFADKTLFTTRAGFPVWRSDELERLWPYGLSEIGSVTFESAGYVARYITKKVSGNEILEAAHYSAIDRVTGEVGRRVPEYATMSRRPGLGAGWIERYVDEVYPADSVLARGRLCKPPRFYDERLEAWKPGELELVRSARARKRSRQDESPDRLEARAACAAARLTLKGGVL